VAERERGRGRKLSGEESGAMGKRGINSFVLKKRELEIGEIGGPQTP